VEEALCSFGQYLKSRYRDSSTSKHYISDLTIFIDTIGSRSPDTITALDIDAFVEYQVAAELSPATINRRLSTLHTFFEYLAISGFEHKLSNPVIWHRHGLRIGERLPRDVPDHDVARLFAVIHNERDLAMFGLMIGAGLRVGEVSNLRLTSLEAPRGSEKLARLRVLGKRGRERIVWCTPLLWHLLSGWLAVRPAVDNAHLFLNQRGQPITVSGIQYCLKQYCRAAEITLTCHQLRHTFARRLAEKGMPVDSLAKLLGHKQLDMTQRYIDGAQPTLRADFAAAMAALETSLQGDVHGSTFPPTVREDKPSPGSPTSPPPPTAPLSELLKIRQRLDALPLWLADAVDTYLTRNWPSWPPHRAYINGLSMFNGMRRLWAWFDEYRAINGWSTFRRVDLETWLTARCQGGISEDSIRAELSLLRTLLRFLDTRDYPIDPGLFRVQLPREKRQRLPRYLPEADYRRLERVILEQTQPDSFNAAFDRAWFLMLAHTGVRISELLNLRLGDLDLGNGTASIRDTKLRWDRTVYLTASLHTALERYLKHRPTKASCDFVFVLRKCPPAGRSIRSRLHEYGRMAGVQVTPHQLRHTLATRLLNQGMPISSLRKLLGHKHLSSTQRYAQVYDETLYRQFQKAMSQLEPLADEDGSGVQSASPKLGNPVSLGREGHLSELGHGQR
jgi:integrase/recombinase XerC